MSCKITGRRRLVIAALTAACCAAASGAHAWERDVHYGLTRWLAVQAGFDASQAEAIAVGDDRVDGGLLDSQAFSFEYACLSRDAQVAREVQQRHYPSAVSVPASAQQRQVVAGSESARHALMDLSRIVKGKEGLLLGKLGEAVHPLQDSWAHQGVPSAPVDRVAGTVCDAALFSGHPVAWGGWTSHAADLTHLHAEATLTMARATYEALLSYPVIQGHVRQAAAWKSLEAYVQKFATGRTKAEKLAWFAAHGMGDPRPQHCPD